MKRVVSYADIEDLSMADTLVFRRTRGPSVVSIFAGVVGGLVIGAVLAAAALL